MTDLAISPPDTASRNHLVRRFVIAQIVLAVLFGAIWWSGLIAPRLSVIAGSGTGGSYDGISGRSTVHVDFRNRSPLSVDVRRAHLGAGAAAIVAVRVNGREITSTGYRVAGGAVAEMVLELNCRPSPVPALSAATVSVETQLEITVTTPIRLERTRAAGKVSVWSACLGSN